MMRPPMAMEREKNICPAAACHTLISSNFVKSGVMKYLTPSQAPGCVSPITSNVIRTAYGNVAAK